MTAAPEVEHSPQPAQRRLNEQSARMLAEMTGLPTPAYPDVTAEQVRASYRSLARWAAPPLVVADVFDWSGAPDQCGIRVYRSAGHGWGSERPLLLFLHSGGWVVGGLPASDERCRRLAEVTGCVVASADYRLAPEHPYPTPLEDCWASLRAVHERAEDLGADASRVVVVGDSSGGNLAAALTVRARDNAVPIAHQVLLYPVLAAHRPASGSAATFAQGFPLTIRELDWFTRCYLGSGEHNQETAPLTVPVLTGLPSALVLTAECDILCDEGEHYAARLHEAGVPTEHHRISGTVHGFFACSGALDAAASAAELIAHSLTTRFSNTAPQTPAPAGQLLGASTEGTVHV